MECIFFVLKQEKIMSGFDILKHVLDHAHYVINPTIELQQGAKPFDTSIDTAFLIALGYDTPEKIDDVMIQIMNNLATASFEITEKNGTYLYANGDTRVLYRDRIIKFDDLSIAYHNKHFDNSKGVNPHLHIMFSEASRVGIGYTYLRRALHEQAAKLGLKFNFMEEKQHAGISKHAQQGIKRLSWHMHLGEKAKIDTFFEDKRAIDVHLNALIKHYENTQNISFFLKIMDAIHERLNELNLDYYYDDVNLKDEIFFYLCKEDVALMEQLRDGMVVNLNLDNVIDREVLKHAYGFGSTAMDILIDHFNVYDIFKKQIGHVEYVATISEKPKSRENLFRSFVISDIRNAIANATNVKEVKKLLVNTGSYRNVTTKTQKTSNGKRVNVGLEVTTSKNLKMKFLFNELGINYKRVLSVLNYNKKRKRKNQIESKITHYQKIEQKKQVAFFKRFTYKVSTFLELHPTRVNANNILKNSDDIAQKYDIFRSELYNITTYKYDKTTIVDYGNKLTLKKASPIIHQSVSDMLDIVSMKGWELTSLQGMGEARYLKELGKQIKNRSRVRDDTLKSGFKL